MTVLLDTGPIVAVMDRAEAHHEIILEFLTSNTEPCITCEAVIVEACYLLRKVQRTARDVITNISRGEFQIPFRLADRSDQVSRLMAKYADVPMDLADACLVDMATVLNTGRILTLDSDFRIYRWGRNRKFDLLIDV